MNDALQYFFSVIGAAINGALQVFTDFINLVIEVVPNPDPFPEIIANMPNEVVLDTGLYLYWLDALVGVNEATAVISTFVGLWVMSLIFALVFKVVNFIKP